MTIRNRNQHKNASKQGTGDDDDDNDKKKNNRSSDMKKEIEKKINSSLMKKRISKKNSKKKKDLSQTIYHLIKSPMVIGLVVVVAIAWSWDWAIVQRQERKRISDAVYYLLTTFICNDRSGNDSSSASASYCHNALMPYRRSQKAKSRILPGETIMVIPRHKQIWTIDAMRDEKLMPRDMFKARHNVTNNPLDGGAFLAAYLAQRSFQITNNKDSNKRVSNSSANATNTDNDPMLPYFNVLPTYEEICESHPICWTENMIDELLVEQSSAWILVRSYRDMIKSEYNAFVVASKEFVTNVPYNTYRAMRLNVLTRSFATGPPDEKEALKGSKDVIPLDEELQFYLDTAGVNLKKGCHAMVPVLDMYNHHAKPNVQWRYDPEKRAYVIYANTGGISAGCEIIDSYGKYTDAHLFAKFGFVNGDGSEYTQGSIAALHKMFDLQLNDQFSYMPIDDEKANKDFMAKLYDTQRRDVLRYLAFDDGYSECIQGKESNPEAYRLKELKLQHLQLIANTADKWIFRLQPRNPSSKPGPTLSDNEPITTILPKFDIKNLNAKFTKIVSTCRLITLTHYDYEGKAVDILEDVLRKANESKNKSIVETFMIPRQDDELEYRSLNCLARLAGMYLNRFPRNPLEEQDIIRNLTKTGKYRSNDWTSAHVRLGEIQSLEVLYRIVLSGLREMKEKLLMSDDPTDRIVIRKEACPLQYSMSLIYQQDS